MTLYTLGLVFLCAGSGLWLMSLLKQKAHHEHQSLSEGPKTATMVRA